MRSAVVLASIQSAFRVLGHTFPISEFDSYYRGFLSGLEDFGQDPSLSPQSSGAGNTWFEYRCERVEMVDSHKMAP